MRITNEMRKQLREIGLSRTGFHSRISRGMSLEEALTQPVRYRSKSKQIVVTEDKRKRDYVTLKGMIVYKKDIEVAESNNIPKMTLLSRLQSGMSIEDATTISQEEMKNRKCKISEETYRKGEEIGLTRSGLYYRIRIKGMSVEEALSQPKQEIGRRGVDTRERNFEYIVTGKQIGRAHV